MKKNLTVILTCVLMAFSATIFSQEQSYLTSKKGEIYLPQQGDWSIGFEANDIIRYVGNLLGNSYNGAPDFSLINNTFIGKYMDTDMTAYRVIADLYLDNEKTVRINRSTIDGVKDITTTNINRDFRLNIGAGREWRRGTTRLQGYYGADALIGLNKHSTFNYQNNPNNTGTIPVDYEFSDRGGLGFMIGARGFLGAEYFLFPKMALGAEYSYGVSLVTTGEGVITETGQDDRKNGYKSTEFYIGGDKDSWNYGVLSLKLSLYF